MKSEKTSIRDHFVRASAQYDTKAIIQRQVAGDLAALISAEISPTEIRTGIDLGSGTGFLTQSLLREFPHLEITLNDLSPAMIEKRPVTSSSHPLQTLIGDIEKLEPHQEWDLITSNFAWQWLTHPQESLYRWSQRGKWIALSLPCEGSFREWEELHSKLGLKSRLRSLPSIQEVTNWAKSTPSIHFQIQEKTFTQSVTSPLDFARQLKATGASYTDRKESPSALLRLERSFPEPLTLSWQVGFLMMKVKK